MDQDKLFLMSDLRDVWLFARRNGSLMGAVTAGVTVFALLLALLLPPRYEGEAVVMLDQRRTQVTHVEAVVSALRPGQAAVRSEVNVIRARAVVDRVIDQLNLLQDRDFNASLSFGGWLRRLFSGRHPEAKARRESEDRTRVAEKLLKNLGVENDGRSVTIAITYRDRRAPRAAKIANAFADQYLVDQLEVKYDASKRANAWLARRLESLRGEVRVKEKAVEDFKIAHKLVNVGDETITEKQLTAINAQLVQARAERSQALARLEGVKGLDDARLATASVVLASGFIAQLKQQETGLRRQEADLGARYGNRHPKMIDLRNELRTVREKIREEIRKIVAGLQNDHDIADGKVRTLEKELARIEALAGAGNQAMVTLRQLQREAAAARGLYEGFLNRSKQIREQQDLQMADARIISRAAIPDKPYFPDILVFLIGGAFLGAVAGFMTAWVIETLDRGIRALGTIEQSFNLPALGLVPVAATAEGQLPTDYVLEKPLSAYAEALRSIRTAIHFSNVDHPPKVIVATSSLPGEGKTVFSASLARLLAKSGGAVLLIDADMRRPRLYSMLSLDKDKPDLARVLAGDVPLQKALQKDASGADVLIAHAKTPNPQDLLNSRQMGKLLNEARKRYDMVIIDTPPIMAVADAAHAARHADALVFVVRWAATPRDVVDEALKQFGSFNIKVAGAVLTQVDLNRQKQYGYGDYGYYYGHYKKYYAN